MTSKRITRDDVAREAGVSATAVSLAMRDRPGISAETTAHIQSVAARLGYQVNNAASMLALQRNRPKQSDKLLIGQLGPNSGGSDHFQKACISVGMEGRHFRPQDYPTAQAALRSIWYQGVNALIVSINEWPWEGKIALDPDLWNKFSLIKLSRALPELSCDIVRHSAFDYMMTTLREVVAHGYRKIAVLFQPSESTLDDDARFGALMSFKLRRCPANVQLEYKEISRFGIREGVPVKLDKWLRAYKPDAVVIYHWTGYLGLLKSGFRIPDDFGVAAVLGTMATYDGSPLISGCDSSIGGMNYRAVSLLKDAIVSGIRGLREFPHEHVIEPKWIEGVTLPRIS